MKTTAPWRKALAAALCLCLVSWGAEPLWAQAAADVSAAEDADAPAALPVQLPDFAPAGLPNLSAGSALENLSVPAERLSLPEAQPQSPEAAAQPAAALEGNASAPEATRSAPIPAALASAHRAKSAAPKTLSKMRSARTTILRLARSLKALASPAARSRDSSSDLNAQTRNAAAAFDGSTSVAGAAVEAGGRPELPESVGSGRPKPTDSGSFGRAVPGALSGRMFAPGAMRLSGAELTVAEHEKVINPVIAEAFAQGRAKLVEPDTEDYELLDPEGDYAKQDTKIYLIKMDKRDFVRRAKRLARAAGIAAPLDIVVHPGPDRNQVYYFALRRRLLERMDDEGRGLIAKHEIYHLQNPEKTETDVQEAAPLPEFRMGALARVKDAFVSMWTFTCGIRRMMRGDAELKPFTQKYRKAILAARAFLIADAALYLGLGYLTGRLVDFAGAAHLHRLLFPFLSLMALTFLADLLYFGVELTHTLITQRTCVRYVKDIRDHLFAHLSSLSLNFFHRNKPTELAPRLGDDVNLLDTKNIDIPILIPYHLFELAMSTAMMLWTNWHVGLMIMGSLPLFALLSSKISDILSRLNERYTNKHAAMIGYATDVFSIMESVKIFGIEKEAAKHFSASVV
ncbi:MAG TPA: ABC transporter ATP-binding protein, partial [Elusimicrobiota bacterium]|nr:ABC transporter ATP-binding protein [Elusimicrobiota bacterium]